MSNDADLAQTAAEITERIRSLTDFEVGDLRNEMNSLQTALLQNPAACELLLPEDIGLAVDALRKMLGKAVINATKEPKAKTAKGSKPKILSAAELAKAMAELDKEDDDE